MASDSTYHAFDDQPKKGMLRTPSWPDGALKRVPTLLRVQQGLRASVSTFNEAMPIIAVQLGEYLILAWTTAVIGRTFGDGHDCARSPRLRRRQGPRELTAIMDAPPD